MPHLVDVEYDGLVFYGYCSCGWSSGTVEDYSVAEAAAMGHTLQDHGA